MTSAPQTGECLAFVCALAIERQALQKLLTECRHVPGKPYVWQGKLYNQPVYLLQCGIGPLQAARYLNRVLDQLSVSHLIVGGLSGGLQLEVKTGTVALVEEVISDQPGNEPLTCDPLPWTNTDALPSLKLISVREPVSTAIDKQNKGRQTGASLVDMESYALVKTARERGIKISILRTVGDDASTNLLCDSTRFLDETGDVAPIGVLGYLMRHPGAGWTLWLLQRNTSHALTQLVSHLKKLTLRRSGTD